MSSTGSRQFLIGVAGAADRVAWLGARFGVSRRHAREDQRARHDGVADAGRRADDDRGWHRARRVGRIVLQRANRTALAYLSTIGAIGGFVAYTYALRHLPVSFVSLYAYINPVIAVALGVVVLGEPFNSRMAIAAALVFAGVAIVRSRKRLRLRRTHRTARRPASRRPGDEPDRGWRATAAAYRLTAKRVGR